MISDLALTVMCREVTRTEQEARRYWQATPPENLPERDAALVIVRHATALRKSLEQWISARAMRAALTTA